MNRIAETFRTHGQKELFMANLSAADNSIVEALFIGATPRAPLREVNQVLSVAGHGLEGDRKYRRVGLPPGKDGPDRELTLIEAEAVEAVNRDCGVALQPIETRRNVLTRGVALNHLVGKRFRVGTAILEGLRLCEPCEHLESLTRAGVREALLHRGGLRAQILEGGVIRVGDPISPL
jgi:MOSC domain-containing protein YiiM